MTSKDTADLLEQAIKALATKKERARQLAEDAKPDRERLDALLKEIEDYPQEERRQLLNAAGLRHMSAAPKPINPVSGTHARPPTQAQLPVVASHQEPDGSEHRAKNVATVKPKAAKSGVSKAEVLTVSWPIPDGAPSISKILDKQPKWASAACAKVGSAGKGSHLWNPAVLAICLATRTPQKKWACRVDALDKLIRSRFPDFLDEWESKMELL
ncbi:MAG: hypothetical protein ACK4FP_05190 [Azonexus sp.]